MKIQFGDILFHRTLQLVAFYGEKVLPFADFSIRPNDLLAFGLC
jgi:hypothetical protein